MPSKSQDIEVAIECVDLCGCALRLSGVSFYDPKKVVIFRLTSPLHAGVSITAMIRLDTLRDALQSLAEQIDNSRSHGEQV